MAADAWEIYDSFKKYLGDGTIDMDTDTLKVILLDNTHTPTATHTQYSQVSGDELATANGYTAGGQTLSGVTWATTGQTTKFDSTDPAWKANGGDLSARFAVVYSSSGSNSLICISDLGGGTPVTVTDGNTITLQIDAEGYFEIYGSPIV